MRTHSVRRWTVRRIAIYALAWLLLGSAINYAQALVFESPSMRTHLNLKIVTSARPNEGLILNESAFFTDAMYTSATVAQRAFAESALPAETPSWLSITPRPHDASRGIASQHATGWPVRSLSYTSQHVPDPKSQPRTYSTRHFGRWPLAPDFQIPLIPLWPGFLLNALIWGFPVLLVPLVKSLRRARRRRGGLCARCGYDLRSGSLSVCPECGPPAPSPVA
jgi:hypothetical protein